MNHAYRLVWINVRHIISWPDKQAALHLATAFLALLVVFSALHPAPAIAADAESSAHSSHDHSDLPELGTPVRTASASIIPGPAGISAQGRFDGIKLAVTPEYSKYTGVSLGVALASMLGDKAAIGILANGGNDKREILINAGFQLGNTQQLIVSVGRLKQSLDFSFPSGTERVTMAQDSAGIGYQLQLGQEFLHYLEVNGYVSRTASRDLVDMTFAVDTATRYELWNDPRRIAGGRISGLQGRLGFSPLSDSLVKVSFGYEHLRYDLQAGKESTHRPTAGVEWQQQLGQGFQLLFGAESFASQERYTVGVQRKLSDANGKHSIGLKLIDVRGRDGLGNDRQIQVAYSYTFGKGPASRSMPRTDAMPGNRSDKHSQPGEARASRSMLAGNLLDQVAMRPSYMPSRIVAKVDTTAAPIRLVVVDKTALPAGSSIDTATGDITVPLGTAVTSIASITRNLAVFTNTGQFVLGSSTLTVRPRQMVQPAAGTTDSYVLTINNAGGGITIVSIDVQRGSVSIVGITVTDATDTTPDAFSFTDLNDQALSTQVESNTITVAGINAPAAISITGGEYQIDGGAWNSVAATVTDGQAVKVRHTTSASYGTATNTVLTIGGVSDTFTTTTIADTTPDAFTFTDVTGQSVSTVVESNAITVTGIDAAAVISVTGGEYQINGGAWTSSPGTVTAGQTVQVRHTTSASYSTATNTVLTIGGVSDTFTTTTMAADSTPDAFTFTDVTGQTPSTVVASNAITVTGINVAANISVTGGAYQIDGGAWTSIAGTVTVGQTVKVRHSTSASYSTAVNTVLTIGGVSDTFTTTTVTGFVSHGGLTWSPNNATVPGSADSWDPANTFCTTQTINGQTGWRLPTTAELASLSSSGALAGQGWWLTGTWSSTPGPNPGSHEYVFLGDGSVAWMWDTGMVNVTCVR